MGQNDSKLVVEAMEEQLRFWRLIHLSPRQQLIDFPRTNQSAIPSFGLRHTGSTAGCSARCGSRHSVSTKMRTDPGRSHVFDLAARKPVVDGSTAHTNDLACFHD